MRDCRRMNNPAFLSALPLALNTEGSTPDAPEWLQLTPRGPRLPGIDGRHWVLGDTTSLIAACRASRGGSIEIPVDFEHSTHVKGGKGERADAIGWVRDLEERDGALWGRVEWRDVGRDAVASRAYRFVSPGFSFAPGTLAVNRIVSVGLTNVPNFSIPALNSEKDTVMDPEVLEALGLGPDASTTAAVVAINALKTSEQTALNRATSPDPEQFVPRADYELATNRVSTLEAEQTARQDAEIVDAVDAAVEVGKVAPASKEFHLAACRAEGGLERFRTMIAASPVIAPASTDTTKVKATGGKSVLSADELAVCRQMGMSPADFAAARATEQE